MNDHDYEARNYNSTLLHTFSHLDLAQRWVKANASKHSGLHVVEVGAKDQRVVYRPRVALRLVAS